jgi:hypothetical protein
MDRLNKQTDKQMRKGKESKSETKLLSYANQCTCCHATQKEKEASK